MSTNSTAKILGAKIPSSLPFEVHAVAGSPEGLGFVVSGLDLRTFNSGGLDDGVRQELELLLAQRGFAVFAEQYNLSGDDQVRASELFGSRQIHSTHGVHPEAPNRHIFRLSNDQERGIIGVGPQWHNDGSFLEAPFSHVGYYSVRAPSITSGVGGETWFASTALAYEKLAEEEKKLWENLASINSNGGVVHPVVYHHDLTGEKHVYLHLGMTGAVLDFSGDKENPRLLNAEQMKTLFVRYNDLLNDGEVHHRFRYRTGDLVIIDNLSVSHKADESGHRPLEPSRSEDGLRIVHRMTVAGKRAFHASKLLPGVGFINIEGRNPFNKDGVWRAGGLGFRWDEEMQMRN